MTWAVLLEARSANLVESLFARKRKSGPSRWRCDADKLACFVHACSFSIASIAMSRVLVGRVGS